MTNFKEGMKVRALIEGDWHAAYIYAIESLSDGSKRYKVKRRDWNAYAELNEQQLERLGRGEVMATNTRYNVGDKVEALQGTNWFKATILEKKHGLYYIKYDEYIEWDWLGDEDLKDNAPLVVKPVVPNQLPEQQQQGSGGGGSNAVNYVVILSKDALYRVSAKDGSFTLLSPKWMNVKAMAAAGDSVFVIAEGKLFRVHVETGRYEELGGGWEDAKAMVALNN